MQMWPKLGQFCEKNKLENSDGSLQFKDATVLQFTCTANIENG